jgi:hypothetical protein
MIRIFIGCSANGEDAEAQGMLEYTLRQYASEPVNLTWMKLTRDPASPWYSDPQRLQGWNTSQWATPFSYFRWAIPEVCLFEGKAIYMDVDMIARDDIAKLWNQPHPDGKAILAKNGQTFCVMLFDCERMKGKVPAINQLQKAPFSTVQRAQLAAITAPFNGNWNCLDGETYKDLYDPDIKVIHFTKVETQPHFKFALPRLRQEGVQHWNRQSAWVNHRRVDVEPLVDRIWREAQSAGYGVDKYNKDLKPFGPYNAVRGGARVA